MKFKFYFWGQKMKISKTTYLNIINRYRSKNINGLLYYFVNFDPKLVKHSIIRQIIKTTFNFNLALELNDANNIKEIKLILEKIFLLDFNNIEENELIKLYNKNNTENFKNDELYKKFRPLFPKEVYLYKACYYCFIKNIIPDDPLTGGKKKIYPKQTLNQVIFNLSLFNDLDKLIEIITKNCISLKCLYITKDEIVIKNNIKPKKITIQDLKLENAIVLRILQLIKKNNIQNHPFLKTFYKK